MGEGGGGRQGFVLTGANLGNTFYVKLLIVFQLFASKTAELLAFHQIEVKSVYPKEG